MRPAIRVIAPPRRSLRRGTTLVYGIMMMLALIGFTSMGVDWGRVQMAKTELSTAVNAAARAGAANLSSGVTAAQNAATAMAANNVTDGSSVSLQTSDIEFGTWDTNARTFTLLTGSAQSSANAMRIWGHRTSARGNSVPLMFGQLVGMSSCDVNVYAIAATTLIPASITGLTSIQASGGNNLFFASYDSSVTTSPTTASHNNNAVVQTNGVLSGQTTPNNVYGNVNFGPSGSKTNMTVSGTTTVKTSNLTGPVTPTMTAVTNPGGVSATPNVNSNVTWPGGTYYFTSLALSNNHTITFSGPAIVYMNGTVTLNNDTISIGPSSGRPKDLVWYQADSTSFTVHDHDTLTMEFIGTNATFTAHDNLTLMGSIMSKQITTHNAGEFFLDESISTVGSSGNVSTVH